MLIRKVIETEKSSSLSKQNKYMLLVDGRAGKPQIAKEVERIYKAKVLKVNTTNRPGKVKHGGPRRVPVSRPDTKVAIVTLKEGSTLEPR